MGALNRPRVQRALKLKVAVFFVNKLNFLRYKGNLYHLPRRKSFGLDINFPKIPKYIYVSGRTIDAKVEKPPKKWVFQNRRFLQFYVKLLDKTKLFGM